MNIDLTNINQFLAIGLPMLGILAGVWKTAFAVGSLVRDLKRHGERIDEQEETLDKHERRLNNHAQRLSKYDGQTDDE